MSFCRYLNDHRNLYGAKFYEIIPNQEYVGYYENGQLALHEFYRAGIPEGEHKTWHRGGQIMSMKTYRDGKAEGISRRWHDNGRISLKEFYVSGELEGERQLRYNNGQLCNQEFYRDGKLEYYGCWYSSGELIAYFLEGNTDKRIHWKSRNFFIRLKARSKFQQSKTHLHGIDKFLIPDLLGNVIRRY